MQNLKNFAKPENWKNKKVGINRDANMVVEGKWNT